jgi:hypothetical protein
MDTKVVRRGADGSGSGHWPRQPVNLDVQDIDVIANAGNHATGKLIRDLPLSLDKLLTA